MLNSRPSKKKDDGTKADQPAPPQRTPRAGEAEINLVRTLYANDPDLLALKNRRITNLGLDGVAVMYDDNNLVSGLAVVRVNGANQKAFVTKQDGGYLVGVDEVEMKGWIYSIIQVFETEFNAWPKPGETLPF